MENRRRALRKPFVSPVMVESVEARTKLADGYITNINDGGVGIVTPQKLPVGDELLFNIDMPNGWKFDIFGRIRHAHHGLTINAYNVTFAPGQATFIFNLF
jgi:Tfp pilus assembly protein PilZ